MSTSTKENDMKQHDILVNTKRGLEWVCGIFTNTVDEAIICALGESPKGTKYVGHKTYVIVNMTWVEEV